jgi:hypothetical protein
MNTTGIVVVAALAASAEGPSPATRTVTCRRTSQAIVLTLGPEVCDRDVLAFDIAGFGQRLPEADQQWPAVRERRTAEESDHRHRRLLRAHCERAGGCRHAQECDEIAPSHAKLPVEDTAGQSGLDREVGIESLADLHDLLAGETVAGGAKTS